VVYLMGTARSGSTIVGVTLGNCSGVFYAGELGGWLPKSGVSWIAGSERERFWGTVREQVPNAAELFGEKGEEALRAIELTVSLFRPKLWRARHRLRPLYRQVAEDLYRAIAHTSGATHVVDSSSHPLRARELKALEGIDLYLFFLVRDPRSVVASFTAPGQTTRFSTSIIVTNAYLWMTSLLASIVFLAHPRDRRIFVRYERFIADPETALAQILRVLDIALPPPDLGALRTGLAFQGNKILRSGEVVSLQVGEHPRARGSRITALLQLPWRAAQRLLRPAVSAGSRARGPAASEHVTAAR
jgi:hypothetical protein